MRELTKKTDQGTAGRRKHFSAVGLADRHCHIYFEGIMGKSAIRPNGD